MKEEEMEAEKSEAGERRREAGRGGGEAAEYALNEPIFTRGAAPLCVMERRI